MGPADAQTLMGFYESGRKNGGFEEGIESALQFILAHPEFVFRTERAPNVKPGEAYRVSDLERSTRQRGDRWSELASRDGRGLLRHHDVGLAVYDKRRIEAPSGDRGEFLRRQRYDKSAVDMIEQV